MSNLNSTPQATSNSTPHSPLLSLPYPLRDLIWRHAFGHSLLHIHYSSDSLRFTTFFCQEPHPHPPPPSTPIGPTLALDPSIPDIYAPRHPHCQSHLDARQRGHHDYGPNRNLGALFACRQFYSEIQPVLYRTNVFQMESAISFSAFMEVLNRHSPEADASDRTGQGSCRLPIPKLVLRLEILMFHDAMCRHWPLVLTPRSLLWVEAHVSRLEISGYIDQAQSSIAVASLWGWCRALEVPQFRQDLCIVETFTVIKSQDYVELRPPSPSRVRYQRLNKKHLLRDVRQLGVRGSNVSPAFHIRSALAKLSGRMMTMEEFIDQQVLESSDTASQAYYET